MNNARANLTPRVEIFMAISYLTRSTRVDQVRQPVGFKKSLRRIVKFHSFVSVSFNIPFVPKDIYSIVKIGISGRAYSKKFLIDESSLIAIQLFEKRI